MNLSVVQEITNSQLKTDLPDFGPGCTVSIDVLISEGDKSRIQVFEGVVIQRSGRGIGENFTVRKISSQIGVERTFPVHSPIIKERLEEPNLITYGNVQVELLDLKKKDKHKKAGDASFYLI